MDPHDLSTWSDPRLARWAAVPAPIPRRPRTPLGVPRTLFDACGGEVPFWLAWLRGEVDREVQAWLRQQAEHDADLQRDLRSIEQPQGTGYSTRAARLEVRNALEACSYLVPAPSAGAAADADAEGASDEEETETNLALAGQASSPRWAAPQEANVGGRLAELRRRIRSGLFALLTEVEIIVPAGDEVAEGTRLFQHLVGMPAVSKFLQLQQLQARPAGPQPPARDRLLRALAPELFARDSDRFRHHLSFRLFLRARLRHYCRRRGWLPAGPRFQDLPTAFAALSRERIGTIVRGVLTAREALEAAGVPCRQVVALLQTAS